MANLKLTQVAKSYSNSVTVLENIDLEINTGELIVFVGPSGCGKSTLLRMIAGLELISDGTLEIDGQVVNDIPPAQRGIAMVFQSYALYPHMTVRDNMAFALKIAGKPKAEMDAAITRAAKILQLEDYLDRLPKALSGGQRQRVAIGRAIVRDPKVYLFDEPLSNLDAALRVATRIEIAQLKEAMPDSTMIYVTHDQVEAMTLASRIVVLADKGISQVGTPLELYERPENEFVARFIGSPAMNLIAGQVVATGAQTVVRLENGNEITSTVPTTEADMGLAVNIGVRPEDLTETDHDGVIEGNVDIVEALGEVTVLYFKDPKGGEPLIAKLNGIRNGGIKGRFSASKTRLPMNIDMMTAQNTCGSSTISRGPGVTFSAINAPSRIAVVPEPGMPRVSSGTNDPVQAALLAGCQPFDGSFAKFVLFCLAGDISFHRIAQKACNRGTRAGQNTNEKPLQGLPPYHRGDGSGLLPGDAQIRNFTTVAAQFFLFQHQKQGLGQGEHGHGEGDKAKTRLQIHDPHGEPRHIE
ncbi:Alpha-glucoside transport ATP-binding protein AglK [Nymphon striatum]|nr:Alpha-glucoside transport ATP-binding protein AglK [Nymphon striatum]